MIRRFARPVSSIPLRATIFVVRLYQATLSRWLGGQCRFVPSCSQYFIEAVRELGALRGTAAGFWRLLRCNPLCQGGHDPVRKRGKRRDIPRAAVPDDTA